MIDGSTLTARASAPDSPTGDPLSYASVDDLIAMFRAKRASPVDLLKAQIERIEALNSKINCITDAHFDEARKEARESEARYRRGEARPLDGITVAIKDEFARPGAPELDFVFTVCDSAAGEQCPYWPGQPMTAHWGMPDPAAVEGTPDQIYRAFMDTLLVLRRRIEIFASLPLEKLDRLVLAQRLKEIAHQ